MDQAIQLIVTALVTGATVAFESTAGQMVKDAYAGLKKVISERYKLVHADVEQLEEQPESAELRKQLIKLGLEKGEAGTDVELLEKAQTLLNAVKQQPTLVTGAVLRDIDAAQGAVNVSDIKARGRDNVTGASLENIRAPSGTITVSGVEATNLPGSAGITTAPASSSVIQILFLAANPLDTHYLRLDTESRAIKNELHKSKFSTQFEMETHLAARVNDLHELLLEHEPHIVHFSGHGTEDAIILQDEDGLGNPVSGDALARLFDILRDNLRCVVLNACYSEPQAEAIGQHVDFVVGMSDEISDEAARDFALAFYRGLGFGRTIAEAFELGCHQIDLSHLAEGHKPQLKSRVDPASVRLVSPVVAGA